MSLAYGIPVPVLQTIIDSHHFAELLAYDHIEGISRPVREAGVIAATIANCMSSGKKRFTARDFMPVRQPPEDAKTSWSALLAMRKSHGSNRKSERTDYWRHQ